MCLGGVQLEISGEVKYGWVIYLGGVGLEVSGKGKLGDVSRGADRSIRGCEVG